MSINSRRFLAAVRITIALVSLALGISGAVLMPLYRWYCILLAIATTVVFFQLWQFAPCDKARVRRIAAQKERQAVLRTSRRYEKRIDFLQIELDELHKKAERLKNKLRASTTCSQSSLSSSGTTSATLSDRSDSTALSTPRNERGRYRQG